MGRGFHAISGHKLGAFVPISEELLRDLNPDYDYYVAASSRMVAVYYAEAVGATRANIIDRAQQLRGLTQRSHILYVNDDAGRHDRELVERVQTLEAFDMVTVDWLGGVPTEFRL